ncbi:hypothetical protein QBD01_002447 [Ochrobactrum sp. 19YEA23]|nr:hypothetical protein [Ochrobactrum sp. RH2CCR150]MDH7786426.1 hypothetical protein [Ochrobactrum sp. 19YEA23]
MAKLQLFFSKAIPYMGTGFMLVNFVALLYAVVIH